MENSCGKFEKRLSAYLDGQLPPDEMAEMAAHLEMCPHCSALLDKMQRLDDLAAGMEPDFDDALMDDLSRRIADGLEQTDGIPERPRTLRRAEVVPVWYRYAVVAASIAIVMFVGRMAFKETGGEFNRHQNQFGNEVPYRPATIPVPTIDREPAVDSALETQKIGLPSDQTAEAVTEPQPEEEKSGLAETSSRSKAIADEVQPTEGAKKGRLSETLTAPAIPKPVTNEKVHAGQVGKKQMIETSETSAGTARDLAADIVGRITDAETGEPLTGVKVQLKGTSLWAQTDRDGDYVLLDVPADTYALVYSRPGYVTREIDNFAVGADTSIRADAGLEFSPQTAEKSISSPGTIGKTASKKSVIASAPAIKQKNGEYALTVDSLDALYEAAAAGFVAPRMGAQTESLISGKSERRIDRFKAMLDSVETAPIRKDSYQWLESLYFKARANYDLYLQTRDGNYLDRATEFKTFLLNTINERLERDEDNDTLKNYKAEIERWRF